MILSEASAIVELFNLAGGNSGACHGQMYMMNAALRSRSNAQTRRYLPAPAV